MENSHYISFKLDDQTCLVILKSYLRLSDILPELEANFSKIKFEGSIIFDSLLTNGNSSNRFFTANFDGNRLLQKTIRIIRSPNYKIENKSMKYFKSHSDLFSNSILTKSEIALFI